MKNLQAVGTVVVDIEGTVSPLAFVKEVLFPYAVKYVEGFIKANAERPHVAEVIQEVREFEGDMEMSVDKVIETLRLWMKLDKKITPLKAIQGMIWQEGYRRGVLKASVYADAIEKLKAWHASRLPIYVYSSGSIAAQKLLFAHTQEGDLTGLFSGYFDTTIGSKLDPAAYQAIAAQIGAPPGLILFLSDHVGELDAAKSAEWKTLFIDRARVGGSGAHAAVHDFSEIFLPG